MAKKDGLIAVSCVTKGCGELAKWKGLCGSCYHQARLAISKGIVEDWEELAEMGLCVMEEKPFMAALKAAKAARKSGEEKDISIGDEK